ncbi:MBL fold metallo-hydrolase [Treponema primitia]|uniref:MBL fold metallo-hydrolase n=1 Tax=Treponema primitia TaxID=88058 RepID=UPI00025550D7|nr:MBL fold metallo-hydrolase [Treponema primitia]
MKVSILSGIFLSAMAVNSFAADSSIFSYRVGQIEVHMLVETRGAGNISILINPDRAALDRYIPGGTYTSEINTFLIKTPDSILVVDTGFGGAILNSIKTLGFDPAQVDAVLLTHMHGDHIGGLQKDGKAIFTKARVYLAQQEKDFWIKPGAPTAGNSAAAALAPYGNRVETFLPGDLGATIADLIPGIKPIAAFGHTPGHTAFMVESAGKKLLIWGDLMHAQLIQFPLPEQSVSYDTDPIAAAAIRRRILEYVAQNNIPIAGMHLVYPAIGTVRKAGDGYWFTPAE